MIGTLGELCKIQSGGTPSRGNKACWSGGNIPWVKISDINSKYLDKTEEFITEQGLRKSSAKIFPKGTILFTIFATLGEVAILNIDAATNQAIAGIQIQNYSIKTEYLYYYLSSLKTIVDKLGRGVAQNNINMSILKSLKIQVPSLKEQDKIVKNLTCIEKLIRIEQDKISKLDMLIKSRFIELFGDPLKNEMSWPTMKMSKVAPAVSYAGDIEAEDGKFWLLNLDMVESNTGRILDKVMVSADDIGPSTVKFSPDNVLYSKLRPYLNKVAVPDEYGYVTTEMIPLLPLKQHLNTTFFSSLLRGDGFLQYIKTQVSGTKMPRVQMTTFWNFEVILPPLEKQERFSTFVHQSDKSKLAVQKSLEELEILKKSLMQQYFG